MALESSMVLCTLRRALLVFVAAACASSDTARPRAWGRPKKPPPPQVQQLTQLQLRQHAEWEKAADTAEAEASWAASDAEEEAAAAQRDLLAEAAELRIDVERLRGGARDQSGALSETAKPRLLSRPTQQESQAQQLRARGAAMADRAKRLRGGGLGELYQSGVLTAVGTPAAASASALAVLLARAGAWHRPRALTGHAALALGSTLVLGATLAMQAESATLAALVSACTLHG